MTTTSNGSVQLGAWADQRHAWAEDFVTTLLSTESERIAGFDSISLARLASELQVQAAYDPRRLADIAVCALKRLAVAK